MALSPALLLALALALTAAPLPPPAAAPPSAPSLVQRSWTQDDGLPQNGVAAVTQTADGALWVGTQEGLARFDGAPWEVLDSARGLPCNDVLSLYAQAQDTLWVGTQGCGLVRYEHGRFRALPTTSQGADDSVQAFLPAADGGMWVAPERVRYRYKLEGYDPDWVDAGPRRQAFYTNLPAGEYRFRVQVQPLPGGSTWQDASGAAQAEPVEASFAFRRHPRPLETPAVWAAGLLVLGGLAAAAYRLRMRRLRERERELTERVEARTGELARVNRALIRVAEESADTEESLRRLIDRLPTAITVYVDGRASYANDAALRLLGYEHFSELEGAPLGAHTLPEEGAAPGAREPAAPLDEAAPVREARLRRRDGSVAVVEASGVSLTFGGRAAYVSVVRDVTQAQQMEARLRLSDRMASVGTLAAGVAHEINNPLAFVVSNLRYGAQELRGWERALEAGRAPALEDLREVAQALDEACHGADRVKHIVKDLKTFSRGGEQPTRIDLRPVLESSLSMASNEVRHRARLAKELGPVPFVMASEAKLGQVFLNLVVNAAQAIREGAADSNEISVRTFTDDAGRAVVEVQDSGCGIPPEHLRCIFDPFFTTKPVGEGTGLGLSICHSIVTGLGGDIQVESRPGRGTLFRVLLPPAEEAPSAGTPALRTPPGPRARILVVDDEPLVAKGLVRLLCGEHDAEAVTSARTALQRLLAGEPFDLVFCDVMMPELSGRDFYEALGQAAPALQGRVVFVTGGAFTPEARRFVEQVSDQVSGHVLAKPFDAGEVLALVRDRLARSSAA